jgi:hypothetical protein
MKQGTFERQIHIRTDSATVIRLLADYSQHHRIHPLIEKVERAKEEPAGMKRYFITDHLQWGPIKFKIKYRADILAVTEDTIHTEAYQSPQTFITNITKVIPEDDGVLLHETVTMKAPDLLFGYAFQQAQSAHEEMLRHIKVFIENNK